MHLSRPVTASLLAVTLAASALTAAAATAEASTPSPAPQPILTGGTTSAQQDDTVPYAPQNTPAATSNPGGLLRADVASSTTHTLDVVIVDRKTANSNKTTTANVSSLVSQVSSYWNQQSGGKVSFSVKTVKRLTTSTGCSTTGDITSLWAQASKAVSGHDWWGGGYPQYGPSAREHLVVLFPYDTNDDYVTGKDTGNSTCAGTLGLGTTPTTASTGNNGLTFALFGSSAAFDTSKPAFYTAGQSLAHELGHNFGLQHSSTWWCDKGANDTVMTTSSSACYMMNYEDPYDVMGAGFDDKGIPYLSAPQKARLGVLSSGQRVTVSPSSSTTNVSLAAAPATEVGASSTADQLASFKDPATGDTYYVEYRPSIGNNVTFPLFSAATPTYPRGVWTIYGTDYDRFTYKIDNGVRILRYAASDTYGWNKYEQSIVPVGAASTSTTSPRTSYLPSGKSFTTRSGTLTISVGSQSSTAANVTFTVKRHTPTLAVASSTKTQRYRQSAATVAARVGQVGGKYSTGTITFKDGSTTLASVRTSSVGYAAYKLPSTLSVRAHTITAVFTPDTATAARALGATGSTPVTVYKASVSSVGTQLGDSTLKVKQRPHLAIGVHVTGISTPTGYLYVYLNGHKVATTAMHTSSKGRVVVDLPAVTKKGTYSLVVHYSGSTTINASVSKAITLRVS